ncbi:hypothetical protein Tco_1273140 [Tanacetum coccineum]
MSKVSVRLLVRNSIYDGRIRWWQRQEYKSGGEDLGVVAWALDDVNKEEYETRLIYVNVTDKLCIVWSEY